jgi:hypothetical protein
MCVYSFFKSARGSYSLGACQLEDLQYQLSYQQAIMEGAETTSMFEVRLQAQQRNLILFLGEPA